MKENKDRHPSKLHERHRQQDVLIKHLNKEEDTSAVKITQRTQINDVGIKLLLRNDVENEKWNNMNSHFHTACTYLQQDAFDKKTSFQGSENKKSNRIRWR